MLAVRQRAAGIAQTARQSAANKAITRPRQQHAKRSYASDHGHGHDHHHHGHGVEESPGKIFYTALGAFGIYFAVYNIKDAVGEGSSLSKWVDWLRPDRATVMERNTIMTEAFEQAASDRMLFISATPRPGFETRTAELISSGCPNNVPAGHYMNLDKITEHYRQKYLEEEERKAKLLAEAKK